MGLRYLAFGLLLPLQCFYNLPYVVILWELWNKCKTYLRLLNILTGEPTSQRGGVIQETDIESGCRKGCSDTLKNAPIVCCRHFPVTPDHIIARLVEIRSTLFKAFDRHQAYWILYE